MKLTQNKNKMEFNKINFSKFQMISIFTILFLNLFIYIGPSKLINISSNSAIFSYIIIFIIVFFIYKYIINNIFKESFDFLEFLKNTFPLSFQKTLGIIIFFYCIAFNLLLIKLATQVLKDNFFYNVDYLSAIIYYLVALIVALKAGFNSILKLSPIIFILTFFYILISSAIIIPDIDVYNFFPLLGNGISSLVFNNIQNISMFAPFLFILFFNITNIDKQKTREATTETRKSHINKKTKIFNIIALIIFTLTTIILFTFIGTTTLQNLDTKALYISSHPGFLEPISILIYSVISFISIGFIALCGCYTLKKFNLITNINKTEIIYFLIICGLLIIPESILPIKYLIHYFNIASIIITFIFPIFTIIIYKIKGAFINEKN